MWLLHVNAVVDDTRLIVLGRCQFSDGAGPILVIGRRCGRRKELRYAFGTRPRNL